MFAWFLHILSLAGYFHDKSSEYIWASRKKNFFICINVFSFFAAQEYTVLNTYVAFSIQVNGIP